MKMDPLRAETTKGIRGSRQVTIEGSIITGLLILDHWLRQGPGFPVIDMPTAAPLDPTDTSNTFTTSRFPAAVLGVDVVTGLAFEFVFHI